MKKITLFSLMVVLCSFTAMAQFTFPLDTGSYQTTGPTPVVTVAVNDIANSATVPAGVYDTFTVTYDWSDPLVSDPWSSEEALNFTTTAGTTLVDPPTSGGATSGASTTLTFSGAIPGGSYDPSVDGFLELGLFRSYSAPADITNISVTIFPVPACTSPAATASVVDDCPNSQFSIDVDITDLGDATSLTISNDAGVPATTGITATGVVTVGPFDTVSVVNLTLEHEQDSVCNVDLGAFNSACIPSNDDCANATVLSGPSTTAYNTLAATSDGPTTSCGTTPGGPNVWFVYTTSGTGDLNVSTCNDADHDTKINVYSGSCGALVCVDGNDDGTGCSGFTSDLTLAALPAGTYYIALSGFSGATGTGNFTLNFTLSDGLDLENPTTFTYYPNPVQNTLTLNAQNNIENVRMYNMLGQEVMRVQPQTLDSDLDMSGLERGTYFVQVTIANVTKTVRVIKQ